MDNYYTRLEVYNLLRHRFPKHSMSIMNHVQKVAQIKEVYAGTKPLMKHSELVRYIDAVAALPVVERNGFMVLADAP